MNKLIVETYFANFENYDMFAAAVEPLKAKGVGVELHIFDDSDFNRRLCAQRARFQDYYTTFHGPHKGVEAAAPMGSPTQEKMISAWREAYRIYRLFQGHSMVLHTNQRAFQPQEKAALQKQSIDTMNILLDMAQEQQVQVLVENVGWANTSSLLFDEDEFIALFQRLRPWACCLIDTGHAFINRWNMERVISALAPKIKAYHLHNNDGVKDIHRPVFGQGLFYSLEDTIKLLKIMEKYTPDADWILEYAPYQDVTPQLVVQECERLYQLLEQGILK